MTGDELFDYITSQMSAETALRLLLEFQVESYAEIEKIGDNHTSPIMIIAQACKYLGWNIVLLSGDSLNEIVKGFIIGSPEHLDSIQEKLNKN